MEDKQLLAEIEEAIKNIIRILSVTSSAAFVESGAKALAYLVRTRAEVKKAMA